MQIKLTNLAKELMSAGLKDPANNEQLASFIPSKGTPASAGFDIRACIDEPKTIAFGETLLVPCGFHLYIKDPNLVGKLYVRSSVGTKLGLVLANGTGVVDSDYQDEWMLAIRCHKRKTFYTKAIEVLNALGKEWLKVPESLRNSSRLLACINTAVQAIENESKDFVTIYPAQRLAQVVFTPVKHPMFYHVESFTESSERLGGFGSTDRLPNDGKTYEG